MSTPLKFCHRFCPIFIILKILKNYRSLRVMNNDFPIWAKRAARQLPPQNLCGVATFIYSIIPKMSSSFAIRYSLLLINKAIVEKDIRRLAATVPASDAGERAED
jgi:hypothetical protein